MTEIIRICAYCNEEFTTKAKKQKYCCLTHAKYASKARKEETRCMNPSLYNCTHCTRSDCDCELPLTKEESETLDNLIENIVYCNSALYKEIER